MSPAVPRARRGALPALVAAVSFLGILATAALLLDQVDVPDPGSWTGIRPLERKVEMLEAFGEKGPVDALVLGSSIVDFGFSAELFSRLMSQRLGREYRAFNFATGGTEPRTLPKLYRLARTVARPRSVFVVLPPEPKLPDRINPEGPDFAIMSSPAGAVLKHDWLLRASRHLWNSRLLRSAPAIRTVFISGNARQLASALGTEAFAVDAHGDRVSYLLPWAADKLPMYKEQLQVAVSPFPEPGPDTPQRLRRMLDFYFARLDIAAIEELARLVRRDGGELVLVSHSGSAMLWNGPPPNPAFERGRQDFFKALAAALGAGFFDAAASVDVPVFALSDHVHLNKYGAEVYTRAAFTSMTGEVVRAPDQLNAASIELPPADVLGTADPTFNSYCSLLRRPAGESDALLRFRMVNTLAVPRLPPGPLFAALRMPDGRDVVAPAVALGAADFVAEVDLPPSARPQALVLRLLHGEGSRRAALPNPLADYEWVTSYPREPVAVARKPNALQRAAFWALRFFMDKDAYENAMQRIGGGEAASGASAPEPPAGRVQLMALPPVRSAGEPLYIAVKQRAPLSELDLRLRAASADGRFVDLGRAAPRAEELLRVPLPRDIAPGLYEVEARDRESGAEVTRSEPVRIDQAAR